MYTDPGSGLLFTQIAVSVLLTVVYRCRRAIASIFGRSNRSKDQTGPQ
jgi:hypothetical protein